MYTAIKQLVEQKAAPLNRKNDIPLDMSSIDWKYLSATDMQLYDKYSDRNYGVLRAKICKLVNKPNKDFCRVGRNTTGTLYIYGIENKSDFYIMYYFRFANQVRYQTHNATDKLDKFIESVDSTDDKVFTEHNAIIEHYAIAHGQTYSECLDRLRVIYGYNIDDIITGLLSDGLIPTDMYQSYQSKQDGLYG